MLDTMRTHYPFSAPTHVLEPCMHHSRFFGAHLITMPFIGLRTSNLETINLSITRHLWVTKHFVSPFMLFVDLYTVLFDKCNSAHHTKVTFAPSPSWLKCGNPPSHPNVAWRFRTKGFAQYRKQVTKSTIIRYMPNLDQKFIEFSHLFMSLIPMFCYCPLQTSPPFGSNWLWYRLWA